MHRITRCLSGCEVDEVRGGRLLVLSRQVFIGNGLAATVALDLDLYLAKYAVLDMAAPIRRIVPRQRQRPGSSGCSISMVAFQLLPERPAARRANRPARIDLLD